MIFKWKICLPTSLSSPSGGDTETRVSVIALTVTRSLWRPLSRCKQLLSQMDCSVCPDVYTGGNYVTLNFMKTGMSEDWHRWNVGWYGCAWSGRYAAEMFQITGLLVAWLPQTLSYTPKALSPCLSSMFPMFIPSFGMLFGVFCSLQLYFCVFMTRVFSSNSEMLISRGWPKLHSSYSS